MPCARWTYLPRRLAHLHLSSLLSSTHLRFVDLVFVVFLRIKMHTFRSALGVGAIILSGVVGAQRKSLHFLEIMVGLRRKMILRHGRDIGSNSSNRVLQ